MLGGIILESNTNRCTEKQGTLPQCAPLAVPFVPMQQSASPAYEPGEALARGTLFPGLDLPFMNMVNQNDYTGTPLGEVMALGFVVNELQLYLDTHPTDDEAFQTLRSMLALSAEADRRYTAKYGPLCLSDLAEAKSYTWLTDPWPWQYQK